MKIFGISFGRKKKTSSPSDIGQNAQSDLLKRTRDVSSQPPPIRTVSLAKLKRVKSPVLSFNLRTGTDGFQQPEYDMAEIGRVEDVEGYVSRAFTLKEGLMFKEGWELVGKNPTTIKYIKKRFNQISRVTGIPIQATFRGIGEDVIRFSNNFLVKVRNANASGGRPRKDLGSSRVLQPVAGYFHMPVSTVRIKRNKFGRVLKYRQELPGGEHKDFSPENVIHIYAKRKKGFAVGTPSLIPILDDIRALRRIEENIEMLVYQHLFPLYHYKVGTPETPAREYPDGTREVDVVKQEIEIMPAEGMIVTPERHEITALGAEGRALRAEGYLKHFKQRIFAGLGVSAIDMGEGDTANRSTADSMSRNLVDDVKYYQRIIEEAINEHIIKELLLESTFSDPLSEENLVQIRFNEIDIDSKIKAENHAINSFNGYAITHSEMRRLFGREPLTDKEWEDTFWKRIEEPKTLMQSIDEPWSPEAKAAARSSQTSIMPSDLSEAERKAKEKEGSSSGSGGKKPGPKSTKENRGARAAKAVVTPSNQHGTKLGPEKRKSSIDPVNILDEFDVAPALTTVPHNDLYRHAMDAIERDRFDLQWFKQLALSTSTAITEKLFRLARLDFRRGVRDAGVNPEEILVAHAFASIRNRIKRYLSRYVKMLVDRIGDTYDVNDSVGVRQEKVAAVFDVLASRLRYIFATERPKAYNYGVVCGLRARGARIAEVTTETDACDKCREAAGRISIRDTTVDDVPAFHPFCRCKIIPVPE
mgnify:CR=1 FL=1